MNGFTWRYGFTRNGYILAHVSDKDVGTVVYSEETKNGLRFRVAPIWPDARKGGPPQHRHHWRSTTFNQQMYAQINTGTAQQFYDTTLRPRGVIIPDDDVAQIAALLATSPPVPRSPFPWRWPAFAFVVLLVVILVRLMLVL